MRARPTVWETMVWNLSRGTWHLEQASLRKRRPVCSTWSPVWWFCFPIVSSSLLHHCLILVRPQSVFRHSLFKTIHIKSHFGVWFKVDCSYPWSWILLWNSYYIWVYKHFLIIVAFGGRKFITHGTVTSFKWQVFKHEGNSKLTSYRDSRQIICIN